MSMTFSIPLHATRPVSLKRWSAGDIAELGIVKPWTVPEIAAEFYGHVAQSPYDTTVEVVDIVPITARCPGGKLDVPYKFSGKLRVIDYDEEYKTRKAEIHDLPDWKSVRYPVTYEDVTRDAPQHWEEQEQVCAKCTKCCSKLFAPRHSSPISDYHWGTKQGIKFWITQFRRMRGRGVEPNYDFELLAHANLAELEESYQACPFLGEEGCKAPRDARPGICNRYNCDTLYAQAWLAFPVGGIRDAIYDNEPNLSQHQLACRNVIAAYSSKSTSMLNETHVEAIKELATYDLIKSAKGVLTTRGKMLAYLMSLHESLPFRVEELLEATEVLNAD